jgi:hypothetical protein
MRAVVLAFIAASCALAAVDGVVKNQTTGKPEAGVDVTLVKLGQGMDTVGSIKSDAQGKFTFNKELDRAVPYLIQAQYQGVNYNRVLPPAASSSNVTVEIFTAAPKVPEAKIVAHMILLQPSEKALSVNESIEYQNTGNVTLNDPKNGTVRFYLPPEAKDQVQVSISAPGGMPIQRPAEKTGTPGVYIVKYPVKPGSTRFDVAYTLPPATEYAGRALNGEKIRVVAPKGVKIQGEGITSLGIEPSTQAEIFDTPSAPWKLTIQGTGSLRAGGTEGGQNADAGSEDNGFNVEESKPRIYARLPWMLACTGLIFVLGFAMLYRSDATASSPASPKKK